MVARCSLLEFWAGELKEAPTDYEENFLFSIIKFCCRICININIYSTGIQKSILVFVYII